MEIESGFPFILDSESEGEDDYSMGGGGGSVIVWHVDLAHKGAT